MNTKSDTIDFRIANPHCTFCEHSYIKFFQTWCSAKQTCKGNCAKDCLDYTPTLQHIDKRSPK